MPQLLRTLTRIRIRPRGNNNRSNNKEGLRIKPHRYGMIVLQYTSSFGEKGRGNRVYRVYRRKLAWQQYVVDIVFITILKDGQ
jgi:hypothetical protein